MIIEYLLLIMSSIFDIRFDIRFDICLEMFSLYLRILSICKFIMQSVCVWRLNDKQKQKSYKRQNFPTGG